MNQDNLYRVSVVATDKAGLPGMVDVSIEVTNVVEDGSVSLSTIQPAAGMPITATLDDPDTGETGMKWQWQGSGTGAVDSFTDIDGATSATYTPKAAVKDNPATTDVDEADPGDEGDFLRAKVSYRDEASPKADNPDTGDHGRVEGQHRIEAMADSESAVRARPEVNSAPEFESATMTRKVAENTKTGDNAGDPVKAEDADYDTLTYSRTGGADMDKFGIDDETGQITVGSAMLDYEGGTRSYEVEVTASDPFGKSDTTMVTIEVTDVNEKPTFGPAPVAPTNNAPEFAAATDTRGVAENTAAGMDIGAPVEASDADAGDTLTYTLGGADMASFDIDSATGQIMTKAALDYETKGSYTVDVTATDDAGARDTVTVTITVTNVDENVAPEFASATTTRSVAENTAVGEDIGAPVEATDADAGDTLTYTLGGADMASFDIDSATGQIMTKAALDYETKGSYTVDVTATDDAGARDTVTVTITVTNVDENVAPEFASATTTRSVAENTAVGEDIGAPVEATDADAGDTLTYTLGGADMASFDIDSATGQIMTKAALDYETKGSYTVDVTATDDAGARDTVTVTITVTNVDEEAGPMTLLELYDTDDSGAIDRDEVIGAINAYLFDDAITRDQVIKVINLYLFG